MHNHDDNIRPDRDSNLVYSGYKPQSMNHRGRPTAQRIFPIKLLQCAKKQYWWYISSLIKTY